MRKFEVVVKELETAKLTVAIDRITLKLPSAMGAEMRAHIEKLAHKIDAEVPPVQFTLRGRFWNGRISLFDKSNSVEPTAWTY